MADQGIHEISSEIGRLKEAVNNLTDNWKRQDEAATRGRHQLYEKFDELKDRVLNSITELTVDVNRRVIILEGRVENMGKEIAAMAPQLDLQRDTHQQSVGSKKVMALVYGALITFSATLATIALKLIELFWPPKH